ncbi:MAG: hypothetical protein AVDCRST_MAG23-2111 [uncultured Sphingosinicella sp.]|uniref:Uncharacterized protein n=1 Tax=uncultured Sphingosinicella sp. TaxID=478748 RepID=A0A6J4U8G7_9SPHN|nr:MAG: hypothetical protein AVDCRST_MAG23-2111 [uncultured Sphingosinicella sp.]
MWMVAAPWRRKTGGFRSDFRACGSSPFDSGGIYFSGRD